ncbi:CAP domain-containing protein [Bacillus sp. B1-b2]|uniref:CAP domain-containing protein n=1 Tax=Bacillus sp. B1-b2 TaxID=2653201 RepID=UPI001262659A|nr:CAP domain-containing protein [Bacillus sp. B1-b2]KAB7673041.1 sporulation protein [Bacillus sp. B1-b2]
MKKKSLIVTVAAASTLFMASPLTNHADAATIEQQSTKQWKVHSFSEENLQELIKKYNINISEENKNQIMAQIKDSLNKGKYTNLYNQMVFDKQTKEPTSSNATNETVQPPVSNPESSNSPTTTTTAAQETAATESSISAFEKEVVELTNKERAKYGLTALQIDSELSKVAKAKSQDMSNNNYFDHTSPTYGSPFDMMKSFGISYSAAGENIAKGQTSPEEVVNAWMNSEGHRANILSNKFTHIGVGYVENGNYWTQQFIGK